nr:ABC transporter permease [Cellulomonas sp. APG4]
MLRGRGRTRVGRLSVTDLLEVGTLGLRTRRLRTALSGLGIAVGIATVVLVTSIPASSQAALERQLSDLGADLLRIDPVQGGEELRTLPQQSMGMLGRVGPVTRAAVVANTHAEVRSNPHRLVADGALTALALDGDLLPMIRARVAHGEMLDGDVAPTVVLGSSAARRLGLERLPAEPVTIDVGGVPFRVVGVLAPTPLAADLQTAVLVDWGDAQRWLGFDGHPTVAYVTAREDAIEQLRPVLAATLSPQQPGRVVVSRPSDVLGAKAASQEAFDGLFLGLAGVALLVGGIGVANTLFASVLERRRDIGLRRALGAQRTSVGAQFMTEALVLCLLGGLAGAALGALAAAWWAQARGWPTVVPATVVVGGVAAALLTGAVAGIAPSVRASRLPPTVALAAD